MELFGTTLNMADDEDTPRTASKKKKSALSRMAARRSKKGSDESDYASSRASLSTDFEPGSRPQYSGTPRYGEDATDGNPSHQDTLPRNSSQYQNSSLTPIESGSRTSQTKSRLPSESTLEKFQSLNVEPGMSFDNSSFKGEKRQHEQNSSDEDNNSENLLNKQAPGATFGFSDVGRRGSPRFTKDSGIDYATASTAAAAENMDVDNDSDDSGNVDFGDTNNEILGMLEKEKEENQFESFNDRFYNDDQETEQVHDQYRSLLSSTPDVKSSHISQRLRKSPTPEKPPQSPLSTMSTGKFSPQKELSNLSFGSGTFDATFSKTSRMLRASTQTRTAGQALDSMSSKSYSTVCSLAPILTKKARERSFLVGSVGSNSLLGPEELERCFPDRKIRVFVASWNVCEKQPKDLPESLNDFLLPESVDYVPDLCVIGTQESCTNRREWEIRLQETLGPSHVLYHTAYHGSLMLCVFIRRDLIWFCSVPEDDHITTRASVRTKGSVAISFSVFGTSFLFINSHFKADDGKLQERLEDYNKTLTGIHLPKTPEKEYHGSKATDVTARFDTVFWNGDLNFRIERDRHIVDNVLDAIKANEHPKYEELLIGDELQKVRNEGKAFSKFLEGRIDFPPTYKYDLGTGHYDTSPTLRIPSYCDRILFRSRKKHGIVCQYYDSIDSITTSDHHPVCGLYEVDMRPGRDNIPLAAGHFNREVYLEATNRRAQHLETDPVPVQNKQKSSSVCSIQ